MAAITTARPAAAVAVLAVVTLPKRLEECPYRSGTASMVGTKHVAHRMAGTDASPLLPDGCGCAAALLLAPVPFDGLFSITRGLSCGNCDLGAVTGPAKTRVYTHKTAEFRPVKTLHKPGICHSVVSAYL